MIMIAENRYQMILGVLNRQKSVTVQDLAQMLQISESTIRRDLVALDSQGRLKRVHGGATVLESQFYSNELDMTTKESMFSKEKELIGRIAAGLIKAEDVVYIDAGTTTLQLAQAIDGEALKAIYVTNGLAHTRVLARKGCTVYVPAGRIRERMEAIVGAATMNSLRHYNFTKAFMGTNGISWERGFTTPGIEEGELKAAAVQAATETWFLADESKFGKICAAGICSLHRASIITNRLPDEKYREFTVIKEAEIL